MVQRTPVVLLPGAVLPAELAYADLVAELGPDVDARPKELEVYATASVPDDFRLETEVEGIRRHADACGFDRFHLVGYSAGGASALAFCATHPQRLTSITLNEPADAGRVGLSEAELERSREFDRVASLPADQMMRDFVQAQLADGVPPPAPPPGPPPPWMASRPAGIAAFITAFKHHDLDLDALRGYERPVLFTLGGKSHPGFYPEIAKRLGWIFSDFTLEIFEDRHHFDPPHRAEPERFAELLKRHWRRAEQMAQA